MLGGLRKVVCSVGQEIQYFASRDDFGPKFAGQILATKSKRSRLSELTAPAPGNESLAILWGDRRVVKELCQEEAPRSVAKENSLFALFENIFS